MIPSTSTTLLRQIGGDVHHARWAEFVARYTPMSEAKKAADAMGVKNVKFVVKEEKVDESKAKIVIESIVDGKSDDTPMEFEFRKEGGKWKSID